jgi:uncharacterized membrane protein
MINKQKQAENSEFFSLPMAKWVVGVLAMLIAVVGKETLVGLILRQTRSEIMSIIRDEQPPAFRPNEHWFPAN